MDPFATSNLIILLIGLIILAVNVAYSAIRERRKAVRAGLLNVVLVLLSCGIIAFGLVRMTFPVLFRTDVAQAAPAGSAAGGAGGGVPPQLQTAIASGRVPAAVQTQIAEGTIPAFRGGGGGQGVGGAGRNGGAAGTQSADGGQGNGQGSANTANTANGANAANTSGAAGTQQAQSGNAGGSGNVPPRLQTAIASGSLPAPLMTQIAEGTIPARGQGGGSGFGRNGGAGTPNAAGGQASASTAGDAANAPQAVANLSTPSISNPSGQAATQEAPAGTAGAPVNIPPRLQTAIASGSLPAPLMTQIAEGTIPARGQGGGGGFGRNGGAAGTQSAAAGQGPAGTAQAGAAGGAAAGGAGGQGGGNFGGNAGAGGGQGGGQGGNGGGNGNRAGGQGGGRNANGPRPLSVGGSAAAEAVPTNQTLLIVTFVGAGLIALAGFILFGRERQRDEFNPSYSPGLLYLGAGLFVLIAAIVVPNLPGQFFGVGRARAVGIGQVAANVVLPTRFAFETATPTTPPEPSATPTPLASLTPAPDASPTPLFTTVAMVNYPTANPSSCAIVAQTALNLRGDPSSRNQAIGKIFAGSLMTVTGQSTDKKWWRVLSTDGGTSVEGWVSSDFITVQPSCQTDAVAVVGPSLTPSRTPIPSKTPRVAVSTTPRPTSSSLSSPAMQVNPTSAVTSCTVITTAPASLRPDPSTQNPPIAQIPQGTALTATGKSITSGWWRVTYAGDANQEGWIGAGAVFASANCNQLPAMTVTPTP